MAASYPDFLDLRAQSRAFERLGAFRTGRFLVRAGHAEATRVSGAWVTSEILPLLGVKPALGRTFSPAEDEPGHRVAVISHKLWEEQFARAPHVTKATLSVDGSEFAIIGVMPAGFRFPIQNEPAQFWITFAKELEPRRDGMQAYPESRAAHFLRLLGRLKADISVEEAAADVNAIAADLAAKFPETNRNYASYVVAPWLDTITRRVRPTLLMLVAAAVFTLGVACANVANLLLARASTRRKEIALRVALGASRGRILRQLLTESLLLASIGGFAGLLLALVGTRLIVSALPQDFPRAAEIAPDARLLVFTVFVTALTSCLCGLAPGWRSAQTKVAPLLNDASTGATDTPGGHRGRSALVVAEIICASILLGGACFFTMNLAQLRATPLGFDPQGLLNTSVTMPDDGMPGLSTRAAAFFADVLDRLTRAEGIDAASVVSRPPLSDARSMTDFQIAGRPMSQADLPLAQPHIISPAYFATMRIPVRSGRDFDARDTRDAPQVVIVNETLAQRIFPGENAIGKRITPGLFIDSPAPLEREIVAVVGDVRSDMLVEDQPMQVYVPVAQTPLRELTLVVRSGAAVADVLNTIKTVVGELHPGAAVAGAATMNERLASSVAAPRLNSALLAAFAAVAVVLTAIGVYGVMAYSVAQRTQEIGIRLALGAQKLDVLRLVVGHSIRLIAFSIVAGAILTALTLPWLQALLARPTGEDHRVLVILSAVLLTVVALIACWIPARRAAAADTLTALGER